MKKQTSLPFAFCIALLLVGAPALRAADGAWTTDLDGNWSDTATWLGGIVADGPGSHAFFTNDVTVPRTVTLDSARTNGNLTFGDGDAVGSPGGWIFAGSALTLSNSAATPVITVNAIGLAAGVQDPTNDVRITSALAGGQGFVKRGEGTLTLAAANTMGPVTLEAGVVAYGNNTAFNANNQAVRYNGGAVRFGLLPGGAAGGDFNNTNLILTTGTMMSSNGNYDRIRGPWIGSGTMYIRSTSRFTIGNGNAPTFAGFTGTIHLADSTSGNETRLDMGNGSGSGIYNLAAVTLDCGTNAGRFTFRAVAPTVGNTTTVRIGALLGGPTSRLQASEQTGSPNLIWEIGYLNTSTLFEGIMGNRAGDRIGHLAKVGTGKLTLSGASTYTGSTTVNAGVLALTGNGSLTGTTNISVASGASFDVSGLSATFGLNPNQSLAGDGVITGDVAIANGTLSPGASIGTLSLSNNLSLGGLSVTTNVFEITAPGVNDRLVVAGDLALSDSVVIRVTPTGGSIPNGNYPLISWGGNLTGDLSNLALEFPPQLGTLVLGTNLTTKVIFLQVSGVPGAAALTWRGDGAANDWDTATANWRDGANTVSLFNNGDNVTFNNAGSNNVPVNLATALNPNSVTVNATKDYVFSSISGGKLTGSGSLLKTNTGKLTLATDNDYAGVTTILGGTLEVGDGVNPSGSLGAGGVTNNARLVFNRPDDITVSTAISGTGAVVKAAANALTLNGASSYSGGTTISNGSIVAGNATALGSGVVNLAGGTLIGGSLGLGNAIHLVIDSTINNSAGELQLTTDSITGAGGTLTLSGTLIRFAGTGFTFNRPIDLQVTALQSYNQFGNQIFNGVISGPGIYRRRWPSSDVNNTGTTIFNAQNTYSGGTLLREGSIGFGVSSISSVPPTVDSGPIGTGSLSQDNATYTAVFASGGPRTVGNSIVLNAGGQALIIKGSFDLTLSGSLDLAGVSKAIQVENTAATTLSGDIQNGELVKTGSGVLRINGNNNATSNSVVEGTLGGTGVFVGPVTVGANGTLSPGTSIGTLTINNDLTIGGNVSIEVNKSALPSSDFVSVSGTLVNNGSGHLTVTNLGPALTGGEKFTLFSKPLINGGSLNVSGGGVSWINNLAVDGSITASASAPPTLNFTRTGNSLNFSWTGNFKLQAQTNGLNVGISANWGDYPGGGSSPVPVPLNVANGTVFFRLSAP